MGNALDFREQPHLKLEPLRRACPARVFFLLLTVSKRYGECWCQKHLADQELFQLLEKVDADLTEEARSKGCPRCGGKLHRSDYDRKPRGGPQWELRFSLCCAREGCRRRHTPPSVRFLGRRVYAGLVVVLVSAMVHGLKPERVKLLREALGIDRRTLERWRQWWLVAFLESSFWRAARARFMPRLCLKTMPLSLCESFEVQRRDRLLDLLKFLAPITTPAAGKEWGM
jgi:hypothetical protein